tara:strand:+ start:899 stop:1552 length:654 start_codon:yes stop_codon:yes gene_type:complete
MSYKNQLLDLKRNKALLHNNIKKNMKKSYANDPTRTVKLDKLKQYFYKVLEKSINKIEKELEKNVLSAKRDTPRSSKIRNTPGSSSKKIGTPMNIDNRPLSSSKKTSTPMNRYPRTVTPRSKIKSAIERAIRAEMRNYSNSKKTYTPIQNAYKLQKMMYGKFRGMFTDKERLELDNLVVKLEGEYKSFVGHTFRGIPRTSAYASPRYNLRSTRRTLF